MALNIQCLVKKQKVLDKVSLPCYSFDKSNKFSHRCNLAASGMGCEAPRVGHCDASFRERISQIHCGWMHSAGPGLRKILFRLHHILLVGLCASCACGMGRFFLFCVLRPVLIVFPPAWVGPRWENNISLQIYNRLYDPKDHPGFKTAWAVFWRNHPHKSGIGIV